jgi:mRNA-degrading endonuclease RelE of RelBE toxin-antitoxin system
MEFRIADTFTASLARLNGAEQKAVKTTAFDLQLNLTNPGLRFHRLERPRDPNFWSVRVNDDVRLIVHRTPRSLLLCYVGHHDDAYSWAERRRIERHPTTGAAQLIELRQRVEAIAAPVLAKSAPTPIADLAQKPLLFAGVTDDALLGYGVPPGWLDAVREATEETLLTIADHLPQEAGEALLNLATGTTPPMPERTPAEADPFAHPDAQRRFRVVANVEELERALDYPWDKWAVFLHPAQRRPVERNYNGPVRISGSAGTGKTIVALHRAVALAHRHPQARVLLTTFSKALANALRRRLRILTGNAPDIAGRIAVHPVSGIGYDLYAAALGQPNIAPPTLIEALLRRAAAEVKGHRFSERFLIGEWRDVVDAWQLGKWEDYRDVSRLGRKTRIGVKQREILRSIFERVRAGFAERKAVTWAELFGRVTGHVAAGKSPFDFVVVDEAQDVGIAELRFLAALAAHRVDGLFLARDLGQRIFQQPFSWRSLGVDVRGRSFTLRINYRTSHQIRIQADRLLPPALSDVDGVTEDRRGTVSVFNGPVPTIETFDNSEEEAAAVGDWLTQRLRNGIEPHEIGVFVRSNQELGRARNAVKRAGVQEVELSDQIEITPGKVSIGAMHLAKGLEFRAVAVMACGDEIIPSQQRIESVGDDADLEEVYNSERHLLYVACTRARDHLLVTGVNPASEFLDDLRGASGFRPVASPDASPSLDRSGRPTVSL